MTDFLRKMIIRIGNKRGRGPSLGKRQSRNKAEAGARSVFRGRGGIGTAQPPVEG
jgi:hypothetical protein